MVREDNEYLTNHWAFNSVENKVLKRMGKQLSDIENYLYDNKDSIPSKVYDDILKILWRRK